jgi:hypothetical protein
MKFLAWIVSWFLYGVGHLVSIPMYKLPKIFGWLYPVYNQTMHYSLVVNDKNDLNVWLTRQQRIDLAVDTLIDLMEEDDELTIPFIIEMLLKDHDAVYVAMVAQQVQQQLWDQVNLGIATGEKVAEAAIGNRTPGVMFMNPRNGFDPVIPGLPVQEFMNEDDIMSLIGAGEPGFINKSITPTMENSFQEIPSMKITREIDSNGNVVNVSSSIVFEIGKAYQHKYATGKQIRIVGTVESTRHGNTLIAEEPTGEYYPVGSNEESAINWSVIPLSVWMRNFS